MEDSSLSLPHDFHPLFASPNCSHLDMSQTFLLKPTISVRMSSFLITKSVKDGQKG